MKLYLTPGHHTLDHAIQQAPQADRLMWFPPAGLIDGGSVHLSAGQPNGIGAIKVGMFMSPNMALDLRAVYYVELDSAHCTVIAARDTEAWLVRRDQIVHLGVSR